MDTAHVVAASMLSLDIFAVIVISGIIFLIYCLIGFNRVARRSSPGAAHTHKLSRLHWPRIFDRAKKPSRQNKMMVVGVSPIRLFRLYMPNMQVSL